MNPYFKQTKNYQVELKGDLLMVKNGKGELLKAMVVPVWNAVEKFNAMVEKVKQAETK
jgi:hypothetical protein